jgi:hypothetical protein
MNAAVAGVAELVGDADLPNAIALNSTSFNAARMVGPAIAGVVIASIGTGNATNSLMQLSTEPAMRGRVMAIRLGIAPGGTPIGAPIVG